MTRLTRVREALKLGREKPIGLAVLGVLMFVLVVVVVWRLRHSGTTEGAPETAAIKKDDPPPPIFSPDANRPTVVQPAVDESHIGRRGGLPGRGNIAPPADPIDTVEPTASRHVEEPVDSSASPYAPRVAQRSKPNDVLPANPLRTRHAESSPGMDSSDREAGAAHVDDEDLSLPRRPLRRVTDSDDDGTSRRSIYDRAIKDAVKSAGVERVTEPASSDTPEANPLRKRVELERPPDRVVTPREVVTDDEIPPVRTAKAPPRAAAEPPEKPVEVPAEPPRRAVKIERRTDENVPPVRSTIRATTASQPASERTRTYVVHEGDTIYDIAQFELGRSSRWVEIVALNRAALGDDIHFLKAGMRLVLPPEETSSAARVARQAADEPVR
jgi:hypothetical protein